MFRIFIPGVGNIFINASTEQAAITAAHRYLERNNLTGRVNPAELDNLQAIAFNPDALQSGYTVVNHLGQVTVAGTTAPGEPVQDKQGTTDPNLAIGDPVPPDSGFQAVPPVGGGDSNLSPVTTVTPPLGTTTGPTLGAATPANLLEREDVDPAAAIRSFLEGRGAPGTGILGSRLQESAQPAFDINILRGALNPGETLGGSLTDFLNNSIGSQGVIRGLGQQALGTLRGLAGLTPDAAGNFAEAGQQIFLTPSSFNSDEAQNVRNTALAALGGTNPFLASRFGASLDRELGRRFGDQTFRVSQPGNFADFVLRNFGIR